MSNTTGLQSCIRCKCGLFVIEKKENEDPEIRCAMCGARHYIK